MEAVSEIVYTDEPYSLRYTKKAQGNLYSANDLVPGADLKNVGEGENPP